MALHSSAHASASLMTLILVHGAWHGAWCWERLIPHLEHHGVRVQVIELPSVGASVSSGADLSRDAATVRAALDSVSGPLGLCGHSYGGMVISLAAAGTARVVRLIYLCAFMPEAGQSLVAIGEGRLAPWIGRLEDGRTLPDLSRAAELFYGDCDSVTQTWAVERLRPQPSTPFEEPVAEPAWLRIPSTYLVCTEDRAFPPELQREVFAPRAGQVIEVKSSHAPFLSQPARLAQLLAECVQRAG
jgi:pimeloyl-ACP methyl ester carboxylesterase